MKYTCTECRYTYDEAFGDVGNEILGGKNLYELGDTFFCPGCESGIDSFQEITEEVLEADDMEHLSLIEAEHVPKIYFLGNGMIEVVIGHEIHPMFEQHYIGSIGLYDEYGDMVEEKFLSYEDDPVVKFDVSGLDDFELRSKCNVHGIWSTGKQKNKG